MSYINKKIIKNGIAKKDFLPIPTCPTCGGKICTEITKEFENHPDFDINEQVAFECRGKRPVDYVYFHDGINKKGSELIDCETVFIYRKVISKEVN